MVLKDSENLGSSCVKRVSLCRGVTVQKDRSTSLLLQIRQEPNTKRANCGLKSMTPKSRFVEKKHPVVDACLQDDVKDSTFCGEIWTWVALCCD